MREWLRLSTRSSSLPTFMNGALLRVEQRGCVYGLFYAIAMQQLCVHICTQHTLRGDNASLKNGNNRPLYVKYLNVQ